MAEGSLEFDIDDIPQNFQHLAGYARRFGNPEYTNSVQADSTSADELLQFWASVAPFRNEIDAWLSRASEDSDFSDGEAAFLYMLQALDYAEPETKATDNSRRTFWESNIYPNLVKRACKMAESEFRNGNYAGFIALVAPYEEDLTKILAEKLAISRRRAEQAVPPKSDRAGG